jgi:uncharacterized protein involved in exopolysaccharide biosynthesis
MATEVPLSRKNGSNGNGNGNGHGNGHGNGDELSVNEQIREIMHVIFKRWRLVAVLFLLVSLPGLLLSVMARDSYIATGKVLITSDRANVTLQPTDTDRLSTVNLNEAVVNSEVHIIRSREVLERVAQRLAAGSATGARNGRGANGKAAANETEDLGGDEKLGQQAMKLGIDLMVTPIKSSNIIQIDYRSSDPKKAAFTVNRVLEEYLSIHAEIHGNRELGRFYEDQRQSLAENLHKAELALREFSDREGVVDPKSEIDNAVRFVAETEASLRTINADVSGAEEKIRTIQRQVAEQPPVIKRFQYVEVNPVVTILTQQLVERQLDKVALEQKYTDKDRHVRDNSEEIAKLQGQLDDAERNRPTVAGRQIVRANPVRELRLQSLLKLEGDLSEYRAKRAALEEQLNASSRHLVVLKGKSLEYDRLEYDVKTWRDTQDLYRRREEEARVSEAMDKERMVNVEVVQKPGLTLPQADTQQRSALLALLSGLVVSLGGAFGVEYFNRTVKSERDVERHLGLPMLGALTDASQR